MKNIVIDFDGTMMPFAFPKMREPYPGLITSLIELKNMGYSIYVQSCRTNNYWFEHGDKTIPSPDYQVSLIRQWCDKYNVPIDGVWLSDKPIADFYIDDRAIEFTDNWEKVVKKIKDKILLENARERLRRKE